MKRRGPGRPKSLKGEGLTEVLQIRLSPVEREQIGLAAKSVGLRSAAWARFALLDVLAASRAGQVWGADASARIGEVQP